MRRKVSAGFKPRALAASRRPSSTASSPALNMPRRNCFRRHSARKVASNFSRIVVGIYDLRNEMCRGTGRHAEAHIGRLKVLAARDALLCPSGAAGKDCEQKSEQQGKEDQTIFHQKQVPTFHRGYYTSDSPPLQIFPCRYRRFDGSIGNTPKLCSGARCILYRISR